MRSSGARAGWAMAGMSLLFGASFVGTKIALEAFSPAQLICLRFALATAAFYAVSSVLGVPKIDRAGHFSIFLMSLFEPGAYFFLEAAGIQRTLASTAAILISTIPLFVLVLEALWLRVPVVPVEVLLILISLGGLFALVVAGAGPGGSLGGALDGNLLILAAALCASFYTIIARRLLTTYSPLGVTRLQTLYASLLYLPFAAWDTFTHQGAAPGVRGWAALLYLSLGCSFLAYWLLNYSLAHVKASIVSAFTNVIPVVGTVLAVALLGERLYPLQAVGAVVVLGSTWLLAIRHVKGGNGYDNPPDLTNRST